MLVVILLLIRLLRISIGIRQASVRSAVRNATVPTGTELDLRGVRPVLQRLDLLIVQNTSVVCLLLLSHLSHGELLVSDQSRALLVHLLLLLTLECSLLFEHFRLLHLTQKRHLGVVLDLLLLDTLLLLKHTCHVLASLFS